MAQQDTGLGWSAKSDWLSLSALSVISQISEFTGDIINVPVTGDSVGDVISSGAYIGTVRDVRGNTWELYAGGNFNGKVCIAGFGNYSGKAIVVPVSLESGITIKLAYKNTVSGSTYSQNSILSDYDSTTQRYYTNRRELWTPDTVYADGVTPQSPLTMSTASSLNIARSPGYTTESIYKLNSGPAVVCTAKWNTPEGMTIHSPIAISTNADYCTLSTDGSTPTTQGRVSMLKDGVTFYMSYITGLTDIIDASGNDVDLTQFGAAFPKKVLALIADASFANIVVEESPDPYEGDTGASEEDGGSGEDDEPEDVDFTDPPSTSIGATGFLTIFCPSLYELQQLGQFMWSTFDVDNWRKIIANPMDAILGLHIIPVPATITGTKSLKVAGIDTTYTMSYTTVRYIRRSMGTCDIPKKWGAYLDYNPYTKLSIFLPYIGFKEIDADDVMGKTISLQYIIDILTGACVAELKCGDTVLYSWSGNCANEVPISASDWRGAIASAIGIAGTIAATAAVTGGATAPMAASMVASVGANSMNLKPTINRSGAISGSAGFIGQQRPYIIRTIPNLVIPADQNKFIGYPSFVTLSLGSLSGYNEIASVHLEGIPATSAELEELESILKGGAIF